MWYPLQWPALLTSLATVWGVASRTERRPAIGFWILLASSLLRIALGVHTAGWTLVVLQFGLGAMNVRGLGKTDAEAPAE